MNWIGAGFIIAVAAYVTDFVLWSFVFTKGMEQYFSGTKEEARTTMGPKLTKSAALTVIFGLVFAFLYAHFKTSLWATGVLGGLEFGTILWLPTIALQNVGSGVWFDKVRPLLMAQFWSWLIKLNVAGIVAALLLR